MEIKIVKKKTLKNTLDREFSKLVRSRGVCEMMGHEKPCSSKETHQCAHIYSRRHINIRWDKKNALCLCAAHHWWVHDNPLDFSAWINKYRSKDVDYLKQKRNTIEKIDYKDTLEKIRREL